MGNSRTNQVNDRTKEGHGSAGDELHLLDFTTFQISAMDTLLKLASSGRECTSVRTIQQCGAILARIFSIFRQRSTRKVGMRRGCLERRVFPLFSRKLTVLKAVLELLL